MSKAGIAHIPPARQTIGARLRLIPLNVQASRIARPPMKDLVRSGLKGMSCRSFTENVKGAKQAIAPANRHGLCLRAAISDPVRLARIRHVNHIPGIGKQVAP